MNRPTLALLALLALFTSACSSAPITNRSQLLLLSERAEVEIGESAWQQTLAEAQGKGQLVRSGAQAQRVQRVGEAIAEAARTHPETADKASRYAWEFVLLDEPQVNAWALPGGYSAVYTGLLSVTQSEDELAVVLGHEVAHALARHSGERMSQQLILDLGMNVADLLSGELDPESRELLMQSLGMAGNTGFILPFSRKHESEADHIGLFLAADAGYDPRAAVSLWERMAQQGGQRPPEFLSTHPSEATRIARLQELMPKALKRYNKAKAAGR